MAESHLHVTRPCVELWYLPEYTFVLRSPWQKLPIRFWLLTASRTDRSRDREFHGADYVIPGLRGSRDHVVPTPSRVFVLNSTLFTDDLRFISAHDDLPIQPPRSLNHFHGPCRFRNPVVMYCDLGKAFGLDWLRLCVRFRNRVRWGVRKLFSGLQK